MNWEDICDGCAGCCDVGNGIACPKLDHDNRCTVYEDRLEVEFCLKVTPQNTLRLNELGVLPDSCSYVRHVQGLPPQPKEYKLIPFVLASRDFQNKRIKLAAKYREWIGNA